MRQKIHSLRLVKPRKGGPGDRLGSIEVLGFVHSFLHLIETYKQKPKNEQPKQAQART